MASRMGKIAPPFISIYMYPTEKVTKELPMDKGNARRPSLRSHTLADVGCSKGCPRKVEAWQDLSILKLFSLSSPLQRVACEDGEDGPISAACPAHEYIEISSS